MADATHYLDDLPQEGLRLTAGTYVSGGAHVGLLAWLLSGWGLSQEPLPFETVDVSVVSSAEYAALVNRGNPNIEPVEPISLAAPEIESAPEVTPEQPVAQATPEARPTVPEDEVPPEALAPVPQPEQIIDSAPILEAPAIPEAPAVPDAPVTDAPPQAQAAPRVAPQAAPAPPLNADVAPQVQQEVAPQAEAPETAEVVEEVTEETAPEEAATEIVTEAEVPSAAPEASVRPPSRPSRPAPVEEAPAETEVATQEPAPEDTTLDDLLADVAAETPADVAPAQEAPAQEAAGDPGPPLTGGERDAFRVAVQGCWVVDTGSQAASVTVTVAFSLGRDGRVEGNAVNLVSNSDGTGAAVTAAYDAARRAVLRCQGGGFELPAEKYEQWRNVEMTFNPSEMRIR